MTEQNKQVEVSPVVQQALCKLNVCMADLVEKINVVIRVLVNENVGLQESFVNMQTQLYRKVVAGRVKKWCCLCSF